ncbi:MAG: DEAD/DEAH box helicase, partial [Gammaproteobacteria bacterium]|nr:DEAD/DEAH box helicase [Gammaproteobacteria bacterium]
RKPTSPRAIMLAPTRELAIQIHKDAEVLGKHTGLKLGLVYGGTGYDTQRKMLEDGVDILIGTPGRIIDYYKQHVFDLKGVQVMVLDEADRMFDLGFIKDIRFLLNRMPPAAERLGMLFSATLSFRVTELAYEHMNNPELVKIESEHVTADRVTQKLYHTANEEKIPLLVGLLRHMDPHRTLVFTNTKGGAERVRLWLRANGFEAEVISGDVPQSKRERLLHDFQSGKLPILIGTDVAARGLHIPEVSHVFNFDLPQDAEDYVHRIGRTARAGASGDAVGFACEQYSFSLPEIETYIGRKIPVERITADLLPELTPPARGARDERDRELGREPGERPGRGRNDRGRGDRGGRPVRPEQRGPRREHTPRVTPAVAEQAVTVAPAAESATPAAMPVSESAPALQHEARTERAPERTREARPAPRRPSRGPFRRKVETPVIG